MDGHSKLYSIQLSQASSRSSLAVKKSNIFKVSIILAIYFFLTQGKDVDIFQIHLGSLAIHLSKIGRFHLFLKYFSYFIDRVVLLGKTS